MKKQVPTSFLIILFAISASLAQTEKGRWLVGANSDLNFSVTSNDGSDDNSTNLSLGGQVGYFFIDNLTAGARIGFSTSSAGNTTNTSFSFGPGVRYYFNGTFFVGGLFSFFTSSVDSGDFESTLNYTQFGFEAGYPLWIVENVAVEPTLYYSSSSGEDINDFSGVGLNIGFALYF